MGLQRVPPSMIAPQGSGSSLGADTVDGAHAGTGANNVLKLDAAGLVPLANIPTTLTGKSADQLDGYHADTGTAANTIPVRDASGKVPGSITGDADTVDGKHATDAASQIALYDANRRVYDSNRLAGLTPATGATANTIAQRDANADLTARRLISTVATGTAPLAVSSTTAVANLNADLLDGYHASSFAVAPIPVTALKRAQGSYSGNGYAHVTIHQYAFASPYVSGLGRLWTVVAGSHADDDIWGPMHYSRNDSRTVTWDYLTSSGRPRIWAVIDDAGRIFAMWEAEDPADPEDPDACPIGLTDTNGNSIIPTGGAVVRLKPPTPEEIAVVMDRLQRAPLPSRYPWHNPPPDAVPRLHRGLFRKALEARGLEEPPDIRDVYGLKNPHTRDWYLQLWLRNASRVLYNHRAHTLIPLYQDMFRVNKLTGAIELA